MQEVAFCQRNVKLWVILLGVSAFVVLGYAVWLAMENQSGAKGMLGKFQNHGQQKSGVAVNSNNGMRRGMGGPGAGMPAATPVAMSAAVQTPHPSTVDAVTGASIHIIGQNKPLNLQTAFMKSADLLRPSVVNINAIRSRAVARPVVNANNAQFIDPFDGVPDKMIGQRAFETVGSGVIVDAAGYIVTNHHIVSGASSIMVSLYKREQHYPARIVAADPHNDLLLLQIIAPPPFAPASFANSSEVNVGEWVLTIGNPFGLEHTVTSGIISGTRRALTIDNVQFRGLLQTDAPINPGSSGGALVNLSGQLIGITTAIYAPTGVFSGAGFAIPSNRVSAFVSRALNQRTTSTVAVARQIQGQPTAPVAAPPVAASPRIPHAPWLGIKASNMTTALARKLSYPHSGGVFINSVRQDTPASHAEFRRGDIITSIAGHPIDGKPTLWKRLAQIGSGRLVDVAVWRDEKPKTLKLRTIVPPKKVLK